MHLSFQAVSAVTVKVVQKQGIRDKTHVGTTSLHGVCSLTLRLRVLNGPN